MSLAALLIVGVVAAVLFVVFLLLPDPSVLTHAWNYQKLEAANIAKIRSLRKGSIRAIHVYDDYGYKKLGEIAVPTETEAFVCACRDAEAYLPQHPVYSRTWYLVIEGDDTMELQCSYLPNVPDRVFGYSVRRKGDSFRYSGTFQSCALRAWFDKNVSRSEATLN